MIFTCDCVATGLEAQRRHVFLSDLHCQSFSERLRLEYHPHAHWPQLCLNEKKQPPPYRRFFWTAFHDTNGVYYDIRDRYEQEGNMLNSRRQIWMMVFVLCSVAARFSCHLNTCCAGMWPNGRRVDIPRLHGFWFRNFSGEQIMSRHVMFSCSHRSTTGATLIGEVAHHRTTGRSSSCVS